MERPSTSDDVPLYRGQPIPHSLDPVTLTRKEALQIETVLTAVLKQAEDFTKQAVKEPKLLRQLGLPENLNPEPTPLGLHIPFARFDFLWNGKDVQFLELNTDGTSGFNVMEWVNAKAGIKTEEDPNSGLSDRLLKALLEHAPQAPEVVIVDFPEVGTQWEQKDLVRRWQSKHRSQLASPSTRSWMPQSLVYRRALSWQLRAQMERASPFLSDWEDKKITVVGGWSSDVGMSKAWPALVKPPHCPETLILNEESVKRITSEKDNWILKGALSYSGQALIRGLDLNEARWKLTLDQLSNEARLGHPWVAQKMVEVPTLEGRPVELGLYFLNGKTSGYMCRWGHNEPITETSSEILRPVRIIS